MYPSQSEPILVRLGVSTAQDLACDLGPPLRIHYKEDIRMTIHSRQGAADEDAESDCKLVCILSLMCCSFCCLDFYNYLQHGIDFLISGNTHTVKKIILHTNVVC